MKRILFLSMIVIVAITFSCSQKDNTYQTNVDDIACWMNPQTINNFVAHSGKYSSKIDSVNMWSLGYVKQLKQIEKPQGKSVTFSAWVYFTQVPKKTEMVVSVYGKKSFWQSKNILVEGSAPNKWYQVTLTTPLPQDLDMQDEIRTYVTSSEKADVVYIDDISMKIE